MKVIRYLSKMLRLHKNSIIYWRGKGAIIGEDCDIHSSASLGTEPFLIKIGNGVRINAGVQLLTHDGGVWVLRRLEKKYCDIDIFKPIVIGNNVHIGTNAVIMPGVHIGNNCIIGVGAIVTKNIPDNSIAVGIPAKVIETLEEYVKKNEKNFLHTKNMSQQKKEIYLKEYNLKCSEVRK